jgi:hypothetical protein
MSTACPTAYFALASVATTYDEALGMYSKGITAGEQVVGAEEWRKLVAGGDLFINIGTRYPLPPSTT